MNEVGEEMCQAEVAHHANKGPEYLCSRPEKHIYFYRKALAIDTERVGQKPAAWGEAAEDSSDEGDADDEDFDFANALSDEYGFCVNSLSVGEAAPLN